MLSLKDLVTRPYGEINMALSVGGGMHRRKVTLMFRVIRCKSAFEGILGISSLARLNVVSFTFHLKIVYHDEEGILVIVGANL